jgi:hypothetical protein
MSDKILVSDKGKVIEHSVRSDIERNTEELYNALSNYMGVEPDKAPGNVLVTGIGALEYACMVAKQTGVSQDAFSESVTNVWERLGTFREQG